MTSNKLFTRLATLILGLAFTSFAPILADTSQLLPAPQTFVQKIDTIIKRQPTLCYQGLYLQSLKPVKVLYEKNSQQLFTPASVTKLLPAIATLQYLGKDFQFKTVLLTTEPIHGDRLYGDVYIKFSGDPSLTQEDLEHMVVDLKDRGVSHIMGRVYFDVSDYDNQYYSVGRVWDDLVKHYAAPISAVSLDENQFVLSVLPSKTIGAPPILKTALPDGAVNFENDLRTTKSYCPFYIQAYRNNTYQLTGCVIAGQPFARKLALTNPIRFAAQIFKNDLIAHQIQYDDEVHLGIVPAQAKVLLTHTSEPLAQLVKAMLTDSDNLIADNLVKKLGQIYFGRQGTFERGVKAIEAIIAKDAPVDFQQHHLVDGSGLSRYDLLSPFELGQLLRYAYQHKTIFRPLYAALPVAGQTGTLKWRMKNQLRAEAIHAKTGSMGGVTALAGYATAPNGEVRSFVIMTNGFLAKRQVFMRTEDAIALLLASK